MAGKVGNRWCSNPTTVLGHIELEGVPKEDYSDYHVGQTFPPYDVTCMLRNGSFTPGLILNHNGKRVIVVGQDHDQKFEEIC